MRKVAAEDAPRVREELKRTSSESGDPQLRNAVKILIEKVNNFEKFEPILEELNQIKNVVEQKQISQASPTGAVASGPAGPFPAILEFIKPYIEKPDPFREMALQIMRSNLDLTNAIKNAVVGKVTGAEVKPE